jgi:hypothetical protein
MSLGLGSALPERERNIMRLSTAQSVTLVYEERVKLPGKL